MAALKDKSSSVTVKEENVGHRAFKEKLVVLNSAKKALEITAGKLGDLMYAMRASNDEGIRKCSGSVQEALDTMQKHLQEIKECCAMYGVMTSESEPDALSEAVSNMQRLCDIAVTHQDGYKVLKRKYSALVTK